MVDEGPLAASVAAGAGNIEHVLVRPTETSPVGDMDRVFAAYQRPLVNPCNFDWMHAINDDARRRGISVMLTGGMGNASLSYSGAETLPEMMRAGRIGGWLGHARQLRRRGNSVRSLVTGSVAPWMPAWLARLLHDLRHGTGTGLSAQPR